MVARAVRVSIVAEDPLVRSLLRGHLAAEGHFAVEHDAEVALVDAGGSARLDLVGATFQRLRIPVVALAPDRARGQAALGAGARAVVSRTASADTLSAAIVAATNGLVIVDPDLAGIAARTPEPEGLYDELTPREREVLRLLADGLSNKEIAARLAISEHTVKFHVNAVLGKLDSDTRTEAVVRGARLGLLIL